MERWRGTASLLLFAVACSSESAPSHRAATVGAGGTAGSANGAGGSGGKGGGQAGTGGVAGSATGGEAMSAGRGGAAGAGTGMSGGAGMQASAGRAGGDAGSANAGGTSAGGTESGGAGGTTVAGRGGAMQGGQGGGSAGASDLGPVGADGFAILAQLASDLRETAPTTVGIVRWSLQEPGLTEAHIDFGLDTTYGMTAPVELAKADYRTVLVGMKPAKTYHFRVVASDASRAFTSDDHTLTTGAPTTLVPIASYSIGAPDKLEKGFLIGSFWFGPAQHMAYILDPDGDIVWWFDDPKAGGRGVGRARLSADGQDVWLVSDQNSGVVRRVSLDTLDFQSYDGTSASHDIAAVSGDTMAYVDESESDCNSIFEIDKAGVTKEVFESDGLLGTSADEDCHANSVRYSKKTDLYAFSDRGRDVAVVDRSGVIRWKLSETVSGGHDAWGKIQHGIHLLDDSILIFANEAGGDRQHSNAIEYGFDGSVVKKFTSRGGCDWFGDVQRLPGGNTLINYSCSGVIQEVDASDNVVLEIKASADGGGSWFGYSEFRRSLYGAPDDIQP